MPEENGLSHFIEHMVFKGTQKRSARQIAEQMDAVGGQLNAFTGKDCTCYYAKVIDEYLPLAVDMLSDLALHPLFSPDDIQKESDVILEEIAMVEDSPEDLVSEALAEAQFAGSLRLPVLGTAKLIKSYTADDLRGYWQRHYQPENIVIAIAGRYDWDAFLSLIEQQFDRFPAGERYAGYRAAVVCQRPCFPRKGYRAGAAVHRLSRLCTGAGRTVRPFHVLQRSGRWHVITAVPAYSRGTGACLLYLFVSQQLSGTGHLYGLCGHLAQEGRNRDSRNAGANENRAGFGLYG